MSIVIFAGAVSAASDCYVVSATSNTQQQIDQAEQDKKDLEDKLDQNEQELNGLKNDFRADLEFITSANKFLLILEGRYTDKYGTNIGSNTGRAVDEGSKAIQSIIIEDEF